MGGWVYRKDNLYGNIIIKEGGPTAFTGYKLSIDRASGPEVNANSAVVQLQSNAGTGNLVLVATPANSLPANGWHHVFMTYNGNSQASGITIYIDGVAQTLTVDTDNLSGAITNNAALNMSNPDGVDNGTLNGSIDDVRIYNYALTPKQIVSVLNADHPSVGSPVGSAIAHYKFDEGYGTTAYNTGSCATCSATLISMASPSTGSSGWTNSGKFGKALNFDGSNDRVNTGTEINIGTNDHTISAWIKARDTTSNFGLIAYTGAFDQTYDGVYFDINGDTGFPEVWVSNGTSFVVDGFSGTRDLRDNIWHHIIWTWDRDVGNKFYIDGKLHASDTTTNSEDISSYYFLRIGANDVAGDLFKGSIDEFKVYHYALSADEVKTDFNQGKSLVLGSLSTDSDGVTATNSANRAYCVPGDTSTCNPPVGHWTFDERTGTSANDNTGNGNTGTLTKGPRWTNGKVSQAISFDGANDYIDADDISTFDTTFSQFSVSAWVKPASCAVNTFIVGKMGAAGNRGWQFGCGTGGTLNALYFDGPSGSTNNLQTTDTLPLNQWTHVVFTFQGSTAEKIYLNGVLSAQNTTGVLSLLNGANTATLQIGQRGDLVAAGYWNGQIDDVRLYDYARTPAQIAWDYNRGGPIALYKFDECTGSTASDLSGQGNNGTITLGAGSQTTPGNCATSDSASAWYNGRNGKYNSSLDFDGTDDLVNAGSATAIDDIFTNGGTFAAWINPSGWGENNLGRIIDKSSGTSAQDGYGFMVNGSGGHAQSILFQHGCSTSGDIYWLTPANSLSLNQWQHVAVVFDKSSTSNNPVMYINGISQSLTEQSEATCTGGSFASDAGQDTIIGNFSAASRTFAGQIDDVRLYNYALTPYQIKLLHNENSAIRFGPVTGSP